MLTIEKDAFPVSAYEPIAKISQALIRMLRKSEQILDSVHVHCVKRLLRIHILNHRIPRIRSP